MTRFSSGKAKLSYVRDRSWMFEVEPYSRMSGKTLDDVRDDLRLKRALQRAVNRDLAPQSLIDGIKNDIRG